MRKIFFVSVALIVLAACTKSDKPIPVIKADELIHGTWRGASFVRTGYIDGTAIDKTDTAGQAVHRTLLLNFSTNEDHLDSIHGYYATNNILLSGTYELDLNSTPNTISAKLNIADPLTDVMAGFNMDFAGDITLSQDSLIVFYGKKEAVKFGDKTSDSTFTVVAYVRQKYIAL